MIDMEQLILIMFKVIEVTLNLASTWEIVKETLVQEDLLDSASNEQRKYSEKLLEKTLVILVLDLEKVVNKNQSNLIIFIRKYINDKLVIIDNNNKEGTFLMTTMISLVQVWAI